jgi:hypothetical protein
MHHQLYAALAQTRVAELKGAAATARAEQWRRHEHILRVLRRATVIPHLSRANTTSR